MPKTAAQLVPLKQQLAGNLSLFRFADATSDFASNGATEELLYDNSGTTGSAITTPGSALPNILVPPAGLAVTPSATGGVQRASNTVQYGFSIRLNGNYNASGGNSQSQIVWLAPFTYTGPAGGSVTLTWTPQNVANVGDLLLWKVLASGLVTATRIANPQTAGTFTDTSGANGYPSNLGLSVGYTQRYNNTLDYYDQGSLSGYYGFGFPSGNSTPPVFNSVVTIAAVAGGGSWNPNALAYRLSSYDGIGETLPSAEVIASIPAAANTQQIATTMGAVTATAATGATGLAANTYYYVVTAMAPVGPPGIPSQQLTAVGFESLPCAEVSATLASTGLITLSWAAVAGATGYVIYRSTAAGGEGYYATLGNVTSYIDNGGGANGNLKPPTAYGAGYIGAGSAAISWTAQAGVTGYFLYKGAPGQSVGGNVNWSAKQITSGVTFSETGSNAAGTVDGTRYPAQRNIAGGGSICIAGRYINISNQRFLQRFGAVFTPTAGKSYRLVIARSDNAITFTGPYVNFANGTPTYFEQICNTTLVAGYGYFCAIQGSDDSSFILWGGYPRPASLDNPSAPDADYGTYVSGSSSRIYISGQMIAPGGNLQGDYVTQVIDTSGAVAMPMKFSFRNYPSGVTSTKPSNSLVRDSGTLLGGYLTRGNRVILTTNQTYTTPVKAIVPNWAVVAPSSPVVVNALLAQRLGLTFEVSSDGGSTWSPISLGVRFTFITPATQMQFRITIPQPTRSMTCSASSTQYGNNGYSTGLPAVSNWVNYSPQGTDDTGLPWFLSSSQGGGANSYQQSTYIWLGYNNFTPDAIFFNNIGYDVDISGLVQYQSGPVGPFARSSDYNNGYWFYVDGSGNYTLQRLSAGTGTTLATVTGTLGTFLTLRIVVIGAHILCYANGKLVVDMVDSSPIPATSAYPHAGVRSARGYVYSMTAANPTLTGAGTNPANQFEIEYLSAYLET